MRNCFTIDIPSPCTVGWENMDGDERIRFCGQCSKNVYNVTNMTEQEVRDLFEVNGNKVCVQVRIREDGTVYTDNCPYHLRRLRNAVVKYAPVLLLVLTWLFHQSAADAQGLVEPPLNLKDPRFGPAGEVGGFNYYETANDASQVMTALSIPVAALIAFWAVRVWEGKGLSLASSGASITAHRPFLQKALLWLAILNFTPFFVYVIGKFVANNFGGLAWAW